MPMATKMPIKHMEFVSRFLGLIIIEEFRQKDSSHNLIKIHTALAHKEIEETKTKVQRATITIIDLKALFINKRITNICNN